MLTEPDRSRSGATNPKTQNLTGRRRDSNCPVTLLEDGRGKEKRAYASLHKPLIFRHFCLEFFGGRYWDRTSDPCRVKAVLYR